MPDEVKLEPCPFCGSVKLSVTVSESKYPGLCVTCDECCAEGPAYDGEPAAAEGWNARPTAATDDVVKELVEALTGLRNEVVRNCGVINPERKLGKAIARSDAALARTGVTLNG